MPLISSLPVLPLVLSLLSALTSLVFAARRAVLVTLFVTLQLGIVGVAAMDMVRIWGGEVLVHVMGSLPPPFGIVFVLDPLAATMIAASSVIFAAAGLVLLGEGARGELSRKAALFSLLEAGVMGALSTGDLFDFYVFFELMGVSGYALTAYGRREAELEAAMKFAALSLFGSTLLLMGIGAIYAEAGRLTLASLYEASLSPSSKPLYLVAVALVLLAFSLKAAIFPLHFWLPDAHSMAPTSVSMVLSGAVVNVGAYGILRLLGSSGAWVWEAVSLLLLPVAALSALLMAVIALGQRDIKRLLAYSTASQMGYAVTAFALGTRAGVRAALVVMWAHAVAKAALFAGAGTLMSMSGERRFSRMVGLLRASPWLRASMLVAALSIAGIPPLGGFIAKYEVFFALIEKRAILSLAALVIASALMVVLMPYVWVTLSGVGVQESVPVRKRAPGGKVALVSVLSLLVVVLGILGGPIDSIAGLAADGVKDGAAYRRAVLEGKTR